MSTLNEQHTVHSHPAPACHHVLARQERSPGRHVPPHRESGNIPKEQCASGNTVQSQVGEERGLVTKCIIQFFKPPLMLTYLTYRNKLIAFDVFRFLSERAEELISLKIGL